MSNGARSKVAFHEVGEVTIQLYESLREILPQAFENLPHVFIKPRLDNLRCAVIFLFVSVPSFFDLVPQRRNLSRHFVQGPGPAIDVAEISLELEGERGHDDLGRVSAWLVKDHI